MAYVVYDRAHPVVSNFSLAPVTQNLGVGQQVMGTQAAGSADPPATTQVAGQNLLAINQQPSVSAVSTPAAGQSQQTNSQPAASPAPASTPTPAPPTPVLVPTPTPTPTPAPAAPAPVPQPQGQYKDGQYTGPSVDALYGFVQVQATVSGGKLTNVQFLSYPTDRTTSQNINSRATPLLAQEAIAAQSANVNIVSGATETSSAFIQSLGAALAQAKV